MQANRDDVEAEVECKCQLLLVLAEVTLDGSTPLISTPLFANLFCQAASGPQTKVCFPPTSLVTDSYLAWSPLNRPRPPTFPRPKLSSRERCLLPWALHKPTPSPWWSVGEAVQEDPASPSLQQSASAARARSRHPAASLPGPRDLAGHQLHARL